MQVSKQWTSELSPSKEPGDFKVRALDISPNQQHLFVGTDSNLEILDSSSGKIEQRLDGVHKGGISAIRVSHFGNWFATVGKDQKAVVWDGSDLTPSKKLTLSSKKAPILIQFNRNETNLLIVQEKEIVKFLLKADKNNDKEILRVGVKDRELLAACFVEECECLIAYDSANFVSTYDLDGFGRTGLCQKPASANLIRYFEPGKIWIAYSNNTLGIYEVSSSGEIDFTSLERKVPFELLDVRQLSEDLYLACGFASEVIMLNSAGGLVCTLLSIQGVVLLKHMSISVDFRTVFVGSESKVECFKLEQKGSEKVLDGFRLSVNQLCSLSIRNFARQGSVGNSEAFVCKLTGLIRTVHFSRQSYLGALIGEKQLARIQLIPWKDVEKEIDSDFGLEIKDDIFAGEQFGGFGERLNLLKEKEKAVSEEPKNLLNTKIKEKRNSKALNENFSLKTKQEKKEGTEISKQKAEVLKRKVLRGENLEQCQSIFVGGANIFLIHPKKILLTDFDLRTLRSWSFDHEIACAEFLPSSKRKETIVVALNNGEIVRISADNSFKVQLADYKAPISFLSVSFDRKQMMVLDKNKNCVLFDINLGLLQATQTAVEGKVRQFGFSQNCPNLNFVLFEDQSLLMRHSSFSFVIKDAIESDETIVCFWKNKLFINSCLKEEQRHMDLNFAPLYSAFSKARKFSEAAELMICSSASQKEFKRLAIAALSEGVRDSSVAQMIRLAGDPELSILFANANSETQASTPVENQKSVLSRKESAIAKELREKESTSKLQAELMAYDGKFQQAVDFLLKEKQTSAAIEMLVLLGKYDAAVKIMKNPLYSVNLQNPAFDLKRMISLQAESALAKGEIASAIDLYSSIKEYEQVVGLLIKTEKAQELVHIIRTVDCQSMQRSAFICAFEFFKARGQLPFAKECLLKLNDSAMLVDLLIEFDQFEEAIALAEKLDAKEKAKDKIERVYIAFANHLLAESKFEEAFKLFLKVDDKVNCSNLLRKLIFANSQIGDYSLVSKLCYYLWRLENSNEGVQKCTSVPLSCLFYRYLKNWQTFVESADYEEYNSQFNCRSEQKIMAVQVFTLILNIIESAPELNYPGNFYSDLSKSVNIANQNKMWGFLAFLSEQLSKIDPFNVLYSKYALLAQKGISNNKLIDRLYCCYVCGNRSCELKSLGCSDCGVGIVFCQISGRQMNCLEITFSAEIAEQIKLMVDSSKFFDANEKKKAAIGDKWDGETGDEEFIAFVKNRLGFQNSKRSFEINAKNDLSKIKFNRFWKTLSGKCYYWFFDNQRLVSAISCDECGSLFDGEVFEEIGLEKNCQLCGSKKFSTHLLV